MRVVHLGDPHVRGPMYTYVVREVVDEDFEEADAGALDVCDLESGRS